MATAPNLIYAAKNSSDVAQSAKSREEKMTLTKQGISWANQCVLLFSKEPGCYYYRALNTFLYDQALGLYDQKGAKQILSDCQKVIQLDEHYAENGALHLLETEKKLTKKRE